MLDASAIAAWSLPSQHSAAADQLLRDARQHRFLAPNIFAVEVRSLYLAAERRGGWTIADTELALSGIEELDLSIIRMDDVVELRSVMGAARGERLSMYDAIYLRLAESEGAILASRDKPLLAAARRRSLQTLDLNS